MLRVEPSNLRNVSEVPRRLLLSQPEVNRFREDAITRLQEEQTKIKNRLDRLYDDRLDGLSNRISLSESRESGDRHRSEHDVAKKKAAGADSSDLRPIFSPQWTIFATFS